MGFFTGLFSRLTKQEEHPENEILDRHGMTRSEIESFVLDELERRRDERRSLELQWQINSNFLYGNQRCDINLKTGTVEQYSEANEGLECEVFNQIEPLYKTRQANLNKVSYAMTVRPRTSELDDISKAKVSTALGEFESGYVLLSPDDFRLSDEIDIHDDAPHLEEYDASVIDNILYLNDRADTASKQFSLSERADAYRRVWMKKNKRRNGNARAW